MASPYAFQLAQPPPPTSRRGISPAASISSIFGRNRSPQPPPAQSSGTSGIAAGYNPAMYTNQVGGVQHVQHVQHAQHIPPSIQNVAGPHCIRRPSMSPMRRVGEDGGAGRAYNPQAYGQLQNGGAFVPAARQEQEEGRVDNFRFFFFFFFLVSGVHFVLRTGFPGQFIDFSYPHNSKYYEYIHSTNWVNPVNFYPHNSKYSKYILQTGFLSTNQVNLSLFTHFHIPAIPYCSTFYKPGNNAVITTLLSAISSFYWSFLSQYLISHSCDLSHPSFPKDTS